MMSRKVMLMTAVLIIVLNSVSSAQKECSTNNKQTGPTVYLCCRDSNGKTNPLNEFMYFVPLISPVNVTNQRSEGNQQVGYGISIQRQTEGSSFRTSCEFRMEGRGWNLNDFDKEGMIARNVGTVKKGKPLKNILDYIKFVGEGYGRIDIEGTIENGQKIVERVDVHFNARDLKSPVYAGLYSIKPENGKYLYKNKYGVIVARVNTLTFVRSQSIPKMDIKVDAVGKNEESMGIFGSIVGAIANIIIEPLEITKIGNDQMLKLGLALTEGEQTFTFPLAENLINLD